MEAHDTADEPDVGHGIGTQGQQPRPTPEFEDQEISVHELAQQGFDVEEDSKLPHEIHQEDRPTPERASGRLGP